MTAEEALGIQMERIAGCRGKGCCSSSLKTLREHRELPKCGPMKLGFKIEASYLQLHPMDILYERGAVDGRDVYLSWTPSCFDIGQTAGNFFVGLCGLGAF